MGGDASSLGETGGVAGSADLRDPRLHRAHPAGAPGRIAHEQTRTGQLAPAPSRITAGPGPRRPGRESARGGTRGRTSSAGNARRRWRCGSSTSSAAMGSPPVKSVTHSGAADTAEAASANSPSWHPAPRRVPSPRETGHLSARSLSRRLPARTWPRSRTTPGPYRDRSAEQLTAEGLASNKPDRSGSHEQDDSDDRQPQQTLEGEPDDRRDKPEYEQNDDENYHTSLRTLHESGEDCTPTYSSRTRGQR